MEKVLCYKTSDDAIWYNETDAIRRENEIIFKEWYNNDNELMGNYAGSKVLVNEFISYLRENKERISLLLI